MFFFFFRLQEQIECERALCESYLISICVRLFLEKYDNDVKSFCEEFQQLTLVDEKYDHLINFLQSIYSLMSRESMWQGNFYCRDVIYKHIYLKHSRIGY